MSALPVATPASHSLVLPGEHFAAAMLYLLAGAIGLVWVAPELAIGSFPSPHVAGITHLFTLGWLSTTIFGALYQLLPVALGAPIRAPRVGHASFWTFAPGTGLFAAGVATGITALYHTGIALVTGGVLLAVGNIAFSLPRARSRDVTWAAIAIAITFLASTLVLGVVLLHNMHSGFIADARVRVLAAHTHVAIVGWVLMMMVGISHRLLPMFLLAHGADTRWTRRALVLLTSGVLALTAGLIAPVPALNWLGLLLIEGGVGCFVWQATSFYRARVRKKLDVGMHFAKTALCFLVVAALIAPFVLALGVRQPRIATAYVVVGLLGGIVLYVTGFYYKIVPLLAWTVKYRGRMGTGPVPTVAEMFSARVAYVQLALMTLGIALIAGGIGVASPHIARCGSVLFLGGVLLFASQIIRVTFGDRS